MNRVPLDKCVAPANRVLVLVQTLLRLQVAYVVAEVRMIADAIVAEQLVPENNTQRSLKQHLMTHIIGRLQFVYAARLDEMARPLGHVTVRPQLQEARSHAILQAHRHQVVFSVMRTRLVAHGMHG